MLDFWSNFLGSVHSVSRLKFEPKVSNFPATKTAIAVLVACAIMTIFLFFYLLFEVATDDGRLASLIAKI